MLCHSGLTMLWTCSLCEANTNSREVSCCIHVVNCQFLILNVEIVHILSNCLFSLFTSDPAPLALSAYTEAYVTAELDKLQGNRLFTDVLHCETAQPVKEGEIPEPPPPTPKEKWDTWTSKDPNIKIPPKYVKQVYRGAAGIFSLTNASQLSRIGDYLWLSAEMELCSTPKDGACLYHAVRHGIDLPQECVFQILKRQLIVWLAQNAKFAYEFFYPTIQLTYGCERLPQEKYDALKKEGKLTKKQELDQAMPGPFPYLSYLKYQLKDDTWADEIMVAVVSMMWQITITVVHAETLYEHRIRHDRYLKDVDLVLVFCGNNHYVGACK